MDVSARVATIDEWILELAPGSAPIFRWALGLTILLAGIHKLVDPGAWHRYLAPQLLALWPTTLLPLDPVFVLFGVSEVIFGGLLLAGVHRQTVAALTALSLLGVVINLAMAALAGAPVVDVLIRDLGLTVLAAGVALTTEPT